MLLSRRRPTCSTFCGTEGHSTRRFATMLHWRGARGQAACDARDNNSYSKLLECVRLSEVRAHQAALQEISDENGGNRFSGFAGYDASVDYVVEKLEAAGYEPVVQSFNYLAFEV